MTTIEPAAGDVLEPGATEVVAGLLGRLDSLARRIGERLNPLLVKECRQSLKGRQFAATFALLLAGSWFWSLAGIAIIGPEAYYKPVGPTMFYGYYLLLAFPLIVIVPYGAFRSLAAECEDRTFELVSITTLGPRQIIAGKIGSAFMQMVVYLSAVSPCLAFTYLLRGIDIVSAAMLMTYLVLGSLGLALIALLLATVAREKHTQMAMSIVILLALGVTFVIVCEMVGGLVFLSMLPTDQRDYWIANAAMLTGYVSFFALFFLVASGQITFASDNRSTAARIALVVQQLLYVGWLSWAAWRWTDPNDAPSFVIISTTMAGIFWFLTGVFLVGESGELSRRIKRQLPQSFMGRAFLTWFNPGPGTGYVFVIANMVAVICVAETFLQVKALQSGLRSLFGGNTSWASTSTATCFLLLGLSYIVIYLGLTKLLLTWLRRVTTVGGLLVLLIPFLLLLFGVAGPLIIYAMSAQRGSGYSLMQITNVFWTMAEVGDNANLPADIEVLMIVVPVTAMVIFVMNLPSVAREVAYVRIVAPKRVLEDDRLQTPLPSGEGGGAAAG